MAESYNIFLRDGWDFWYSMVNPYEKASIKNLITTFCTYPYSQDQLTVKYHITDFHGNKICMKHELLLHQLDRHFVAINYFYDVSEKEKVEHCFGASQAPTNSNLEEKNVFTISPREKQVLKLIAEGFTTKEIADMLYISNHTAVSHRKNLIEKFEVKNTAHLVNRASPLLEE